MVSHSDVENVLNTNKLNQLLELINAAPTPDNCQPFIYTIENNFLNVEYNPIIAKHPFNKNENAIYITLGILIKYIKLACQALDIRPEITIDTKNIQNKSTVISCKLLASKGVIPILYSIEDLLNRHTDRNPYRQTSIKKRTKINEFIFAKKNDPLAKHYYASEGSKRFMSFVAKNNTFLFNTDFIFSKVLHLIRFSQEELNLKGDGFDYRNLGCNYIETRFLKLLRYSQFLRRCFIKCKLYMILCVKEFFILMSSKEFLLITSKGKALDSLIESGESICETWIYLNKIGVSTQPMNASALMFWSHLALNDKQSLSEKAAARIPLFLRIYHKEFKLEDHEYPVFLFRLGRAKTFPCRYQSPRKESNCCLKTGEKEMIEES